MPRPHVVIISRSSFPRAAEMVTFDGRTSVHREFLTFFRPPARRSKGRARRRYGTVQMPGKKKGLAQYISPHVDGRIRLINDKNATGTEFRTRRTVMRLRYAVCTIIVGI